MHVIVVGAGAAGLRAAIEAHDAGAEVLIVEKEDSPYASSSAICGGSVAACGTTIQEENGIEDSPMMFFNDMMKEGEYTNDEELARVFAEHSRDTVEWFKDKGLKFILRSYPGFSPDRIHYAGNGKAYVDILVDEIRKRKIRVLYSTTAKRLIIDHSSGNVLGVQAENERSQLLVKAKKATVLATGGFGGAKETADRFLTAFKGAIVGSSPAATGDGLLMAMKAGASTTHLDYGAIYGYGFVTDPAARRGHLQRGYDLTSVFGGIVVNKDGKRFMNEETSPTLVGWKLREQPDQTLYVIADGVMFEEFTNRPVFPVIGWTKERFLKEVEEQKCLFKKANSIQELASKIGAESTKLRQTVEDYNTYVERGEDPMFGRDKKHLRRKIETPPFCALIGKPIVMVTVGGLKVNSRLQVLDVYLNPLPRLYAAGEVVGGLHGTRYSGGDAFGSALCLGGIAGKNAALENSSE